MTAEQTIILPARRLLPKQKHQAPSGAMMPGGVNANGPIHLAPLAHPDNSHSALARMVPSNVVVEQLGIARTSLTQPLHPQSILLKRYKDVESSGLGQDLTVSPNRLVYEVKTTFSTPYSVHGNSWTSGTRIFAVDAETGNVLWSETHGANFKSSMKKVVPE